MTPALIVALSLAGAAGPAEPTGRLAAQDTDAAPAPAPAPRPPSAAELDSLHAVTGVLRELIGRSGYDLWPGFRPDTTPKLLVLLRRGNLLIDWTGPLPEGFELLPDGTTGWRAFADPSAASTAIELDGRRVAQLSSPGFDPVRLLGLMVHESFHAYQAAVRAAGRRFGRGENSFLVSSYPIFDEINERDVALEGILLGAALAAPAPVRDSIIHEFTALRDRRYRRLDPDYVEFEYLAELNEGLAQYAQMKALALVAAAGVAPWSEAAGEAVARELGRLDDLIGESTRSFRRRYYTLGTAMGFLLDRLAGSGWKTMLLELDQTLPEALAQASGYRKREERLALEGLTRSPVDVAARAHTAVAARRSRTRARADSALAAPGVLLELVASRLPRGDLGLCGIDPQNLLQVDEGVLLHTRWLRVCGSGVSGEFLRPVVHDRNTGTFRSVLGPRGDIGLSAGGKPLAWDSTVTVTDLELRSPGLTMDMPRAMVEPTARGMRITLLQ